MTSWTYRRSGGGALHLFLSGFGSPVFGAPSGFPPVCTFSDPVITDYFEGKAFWDSFVTPSRKPPSGDTPELQAEHMDVCVCVSPLG